MDLYTSSYTNANILLQPNDKKEEKRACKKPPELERVASPAAEGGSPLVGHLPWLGRAHLVHQLLHQQVQCRASGEFLKGGCSYSQTKICLESICIKGSMQYQIVNNQVKTGKEVKFLSVNCYAVPELEMFKGQCHPVFVMISQGKEIYLT